MIPIGWILVLILLNLTAPILWVALFNFIGLKRIVERLGDAEDDINNMRDKARSLQSQIGKKSRAVLARTDEPEGDAQITNEIANSIRGMPTTPRQIPSKGGKIDADRDWISESG